MSSVMGVLVGVLGSEPMGCSSFRQCSAIPLQRQ
jgi:hypothetical protein